MPYSSAEFAHSVRELAAGGNLDGALARIVELVLHVGVRDGAIGRVFSSPLLDQLCQELGQHVRPIDRSEVDPDHMVVVATSVGRTGGHSRVIRDLLGADPSKRKTLLLTGTKVGQPPAETVLFQGDPTIDVEIAPYQSNYAGRLSWLSARLEELAPASVYLLVHPFDAVAVAAAQPGIANRTFYYHNSDHSLALGVHLEHATHVDYHRKGFDRCQSAGVMDQVFWPLTVHVPKTRVVDLSKRRSAALTTCCCGGFEKFETPHMAESFPYAVAYEDMVLQVLETTGGKHVHIGELSDGLRERIGQRLHGAGLDLERFAYLPFTPDLSSSFNQFGVDVYLGSMPRGGGRATVEAMGAGLPIVVHSNYRSRFLSDENEVYPEAFVWRRLDELTNSLSSLDQTALEVHGRLSRQYYESHHRPGLLRKALVDTLAGRTPWPPPAGFRYPSDELQAFFDERYGYETFSESFDKRRGPWADADDQADVVAEEIADEAPSEMRIEPVAELHGYRGAQDSEADVAKLAERRRRAYVLKLAAGRAKNRLQSARVQGADQAYDRTTFLKLVAQRFDSGLGAEASFGTRTYIAFLERPPEVAMRDLGRVPSEAREHLFLADVLKVQGFFGDAEDIYRSVAKTPAAKAPALRALGDLLLVKAGWANEFDSYAFDGRALNPYDKLASFADKPTWHSAKLGDAITCLEEAVAAEPDHADGLWLLISAYLSAREWKKASRVVQRFAEAAPEAPDLKALTARVTFGISENKAVSGAREMFAGWRDDLGRRWISKAASVTRAEDLPRDQSFYTEVDPAVVQPVHCKFVKNGTILEFNEPLPFEKSYVAEHKSATVLPLFGMLLANDAQLIPDSLHHRECHFDVFTAAVRTIKNDRALLIMPEPDEISLPSAIFIGCNNNYYHWLIDELPRLRVLALSGQDDGRPILIDKHAQKWQLELLSRFGIPQRRLVKADFLRPQRVRNLLAPSHLSTLMVAHPLAVDFIRDTLLKGAKDATPRKGNRLYVARSAGTVAGRSIINADEIWAKFKKAGFRRVDPGTLTIDEQIKLFRDAEIIAGPGGAGLTNAVFAPAGAKVLNLTSSDIACQTFTSISAAIGQESWFCGGAGLARPYPRWIWTNFDYVVDGRDVDICIDALTS